MQYCSCFCFKVRKGLPGAKSAAAYANRLPLVVGCSIIRCAARDAPPPTRTKARARAGATQHQAWQREALSRLTRATPQRRGAVAPPGDDGAASRASAATTPSGGHPKWRPPTQRNATCAPMHTMQSFRRSGGEHIPSLRQGAGGAGCASFATLFPYRASGGCGGPCKGGKGRAAQAGPAVKGLTYCETEAHAAAAATPPPPRV